jgi:hypothetical protein
MLILGLFRSVSFFFNLLSLNRIMRKYIKSYSNIITVNLNYSINHFYPIPMLITAVIKIIVERKKRRKEEKKKRKKKEKKKQEKEEERKRLSYYY